MAEFDDLPTLEKRITSAWRALQGARAANNRRPNAEQCRIELLCIRTLDELIDRWAELRQAEDIIKA